MTRDEIELSPLLRALDLLELHESRSGAQLAVTVMGENGEAAWQKLIPPCQFQWLHSLDVH